VLGLLVLHQLGVQLAPVLPVEDAGEAVVGEGVCASRSMPEGAQYLAQPPVGEAAKHVELEQPVAGNLIPIGKEQVFVVLGVDVSNPPVVDEDLDGRRRQARPWVHHWLVPPRAGGEQTSEEHQDRAKTDGTLRHEIFSNRDNRGGGLCRTAYMGRACRTSAQLAPSLTCFIS